jgi:mRNA interferase MazF
MTDWPDAGDLVWTDFDRTLGREQAGRRPALVVSPAAFTRNTGFAFVCPVTTRVRPFPTSVILPRGLAIAGEILVGHLRSIDLLARPCVRSAPRFRRKRRRTCRRSWPR